MISNGIPAASAPASPPADFFTAPPRLLLPGPWAGQALCATVPDPDIFYPHPDAHGIEAKQVCQQCPVREQCLAFAMATDERHGVWGGLGAKERAALRRRLRQREQQRRKRTAA